MALSFLYLMTRRLVGMLLGSLRSEHIKDTEIAVLRHQLKVLRRQVERPEFRPADCAVLALLSRALPRARWAAFLVTPDTILGWHRRLVTRKWTQPYRRHGRPPLAAHLVVLLLRLARENPRRGLWVPENRSWALSCRFAEESPGRDDRHMTLRLLYLLSCQVLRWLVLLARSSAAKDARAAPVAPRGRNAAPPSRPAAGRLGRPRGAGRARAAAAPSSLAGLVRAAGHAAALASRSGPAPLDLPAPPWPAARFDGGPRAGAAAGHGEPHLGISPRPRRAVPPRLQEQDRGQHGVGRPAARRRRSGTQAVGAYLAAVPTRPGDQCAGRGPPAPWTRSCCGGCMCCSRSRSRPVGSMCSG
jgi:hypothetical protein